MAGLAYHDARSVQKGLTFNSYCDVYKCIEVSGVELAEPATSITDWILNIELVILGVLVLQYKQKGQASFVTGLAFIFLGISFGLGGFSHGFGSYLRCDKDSPDDTCKDYTWVWVGAIATQAPATVLFLVGACYLVFGENGGVPKVMAICGSAIVLIFYLCVYYGAICAQEWTAFFLSFRFVLLLVGPFSLATLVILCLPACIQKTQPAGMALAIGGWLICLASAVYQAVGPKPSEWFDHNAVFHVMFMVGIAISAAGFLQWLPTMEDVGSSSSRALE
mmetsp:Transcript_66185/g.123555  ORF Transcript_66185/g.123555 Transcript_66185/m.123555 type:complete len:278 (+) Transcript_66185:65-898(+)